MGTDITVKKTRRSSGSNPGATGATKTPKQKKGFMSCYKKTYDTSNGFGTVQDWRNAFNKRMSIDEANEAIGSKNPFEILGLSTTETNWDTIKSAYRALVKKYHPDICQDADAELKTKEINGAYTILEERFGK